MKLLGLVALLVMGACADEEPGIHDLVTCPSLVPAGASRCDSICAQLYSGSEYPTPDGQCYGTDPEGAKPVMPGGYNTLRDGTQGFCGYGDRDGVRVFEFFECDE